MSCFLKILFENIFKKIHVLFVKFTQKNILLQNHLCEILSFYFQFTKTFKDIFINKTNFTAVFIKCQFF